jgi:hypothetical protein
MSVSNNGASYLLSDDQRIRDLLRQFEELIARCPADFRGWQTVSTTRRTDSVLVEIVSSFKLDLLEPK